MEFLQRCSEWLNGACRQLGQHLRAAVGGDYQRQRPSAPSVTITIGPGPQPILIGPSEPLIVGPSAELRTTDGSFLIIPEVPLHVAPPPRAAWDEQGWSERVENGQRIYEGAYRATSKHRSLESFSGRIVQHPNGSVVPYIADPPYQIKRHPKGPCFMLTQAPWSRVHWHKPATNVDDALLYVERILNEALN
jgi:hypothetical protein